MAHDFLIMWVLKGGPENGMISWGVPRYKERSIVLAGYPRQKPRVCMFVCIRGRNSLGIAIGRVSRRRGRTGVPVKRWFCRYFAVRGWSIWMRMAIRGCWCGCGWNGWHLGRNVHRWKEIKGSWSNSATVLCQNSNTLSTMKANHVTFDHRDSAILHTSYSTTTNPSERVSLKISSIPALFTTLPYEFCFQFVIDTKCDIRLLLIPSSLAFGPHIGA